MICKQGGVAGERGRAVYKGLGTAWQLFTGIVCQKYLDYHLLGRDSTRGELEKERIESPETVGVAGDIAIISAKNKCCLSESDSEGAILDVTGVVVYLKV